MLYAHHVHIYLPLVYRFEEEQRELEKRKRRALEEYHQKKKLSSSTSSLDNSGPLPTSRKSSTDSHDIPLIQSPNQSRKVPTVDLENYQEAREIGSVLYTTSASNKELPSLPPLKKDPAADMEKKVRDELMAEWGESPPNQSHNQQDPDMMLSTRNFSSPPGIRSPRHLTSVQDLHAKTWHTHPSSKAYHHQQQPHPHHHRGAEGSPLSPPPPSQSPVPRSPTLPTATFMLPTSPPVSQQQSMWTSRSQPQQHSYPQPHHHMQHHQNVTNAASVGVPHGIHHLDSGEWTEFTSAPYSEGGRETLLASTSTVAMSHLTLSDGFPASHSTPALGTLTNSASGVSLTGQHHHQLSQTQQKVGTDLSEFDPIAVSSSGGSIPSELQNQSQAPLKHRT